MNKPWFPNNSYSSLEIIKFKSISDHTTNVSIDINDLNVIQRMIEQIEQIPKGEMMKSFGAQVEQINLIFKGNNQTHIIEVYGMRFKTPSTGFNSANNSTEELLYKDINALLNPDFNKKILKVENLELPFPNFSVIYKGTEFYNKAGTSISYNKDFFLIKDKKEQVQVIEIISGQLPPQPMAIKIDRLELVLLTYQPRDLERLSPYYFLITEQLDKAN